MSLSVIICSHNPKREYLERVLCALKVQSLPSAEWELLLIDNASRLPLRETWDLSWHPHSRHIHEPQLGLTAARLRGIRESTTEILVFLDDDNVLAEDYLEKMKSLYQERPWVGVWSSACIEPEYETPPEPWLDPFLPYLALNKKPRELWSNDFDSGLLPIGAGMSLRKDVAVRYAEQMQTNKVLRSLDRVGKNLLAAGDTNMGLCACEMGLACGQTPALRLTHLIPSFRVTHAYLFKLARDVNRSQKILYWGCGLVEPNRRQEFGQLAGILLSFPFHILRYGRGPTLVRLAEHLGYHMAIADYDRLLQSGSISHTP